MISAEVESPFTLFLWLVQLCIFLKIYTCIILYCTSSHTCIHAHVLSPGIFFKQLFFASFFFLLDYVLLLMEGSLARAKYSFQSSSPDELSVREGSIITVTQYINNHWLEAEYKGKRGYFPIIYAERITNDSQLHTEQNAIFSVPCLNGGELPARTAAQHYVEGVRKRT